MLNGHTPVHGTPVPSSKRTPQPQVQIADEVRFFRERIQPMTTNAIKKGISRIVRRKGSK